jgi:hypothetical protein
LYTLINFNNSNLLLLLLLFIYFVKYWFMLFVICVKLS